MSIVANYIRVSDDHLAVISEDAEAFKQFVAETPGTDRHIDLDQFWDALAWILSPSSRQKAVINYQWLRLAEGELDEVPADASTIAADQMEIAFKGGSEKLHPKIDFGYGPVAIVQRESVKTINDSLTEVTDEQLVNAFDASNMQGVHPDGWQHSESSVVTEVLIPVFHRFRAFVLSARNSDEAMLVYFN